MNEKQLYAKELNEAGFNCAQSVALPFCRELGVPQQLVMKALEGFGAGMGDRSQTCGALSGAVFVTGLKYSDGNLEAPASKAVTYSHCGALCRKFTEACGSSVCRQIKSGAKISCADCIALGVKLAEEA